MKKLMVLLVLAGSFTMAHAQEFGGRNAPPPMDTAKMQERERQQLQSSGIELNSAQIDSIVAINSAIRQKMRQEGRADRSAMQARRKELEAYQLKRLTEALGDETLAKKVSEFYQKQRPQRGSGEMPPPPPDGDNN